MNTPLVMTIIGPDRPGLVEKVAECVARHGGNWLESRMAHLGGQFAGILRIEVPAEGEGPLMAGLKELEAGGMRIVAQTDRVPAPVGGARRATLELVSRDRPGIVRQISGVLAAHKVNVEELETERVSAAMSGESLFQARATLDLPAECELAALQSDLEKIAHELMADIKLGEIAPVAYSS
jgi:glycine cleavage system regulatory protein